MTRPPDVRIEDLGAPVLPDGFAEQIEAVKPLVDALDWSVEGLCKQASEEIGLSNFGNDDFRERLGVAVNGFLTEANLHAIGLLGRHGILIRWLKNRLLLENLYDRHPEIDDLAVESPIIIAGLPRSGTTHLLNLISADPNIRSLPYWEALEPIPDPREQPSPGEPDPRLTRCEAACDATNGMLPLFKRMHEMTVDHTHEEIHLLAIDFGTMFFENLGVGMLPTWRDYYLGSDQTPHYQYVARMLRVLQWLRGGRRWVLKSPQHLEQFDAILATYPEATVAVTHRDPVSTVASFATMISYSTRMSAAKPDPVGLGHYWADRIETMLRRCVETRDHLPRAQSTDVLFHEYMGQELETARTIYAQAGLELDDASLAAIDAYQQAHPRGRYGRVLYDLADFDLDADVLRERFRFYTDRFPVRLEH